MAQTFFSDNQTKLAYHGGNYNLLSDYLDERQWYTKPFVNTQQVTIFGTNSVIINNTMISGNIAIGVNTGVVNGGISASKLNVPIGLGNAVLGVGYFLTGNNAIGNLVELRNAATRQLLQTTSGQRIFGLIQADTSVSDGNAIGSAITPNLQISFVYYDVSGALQLTSVSTTIEFDVNVIYSNRYTPPNFFANPAINFSTLTNESVKLRTFLVTTASTTTGDQTIDLGAGTITNTVVIAGGDITAKLPTTSALFQSNGLILIARNGVKLSPVADLDWVSPMQFIIHVGIGQILKMNDRIEVSTPF